MGVLLVYRGQSRLLDPDLRVSISLAFTPAPRYPMAQTFVPIQASPRQIIIELTFGILYQSFLIIVSSAASISFSPRLIAHPIRILDPHKKLPSRRPRHKVVEQSRPQAPQVKISGRRRRKPRPRWLTASQGKNSFRLVLCGRVSTLKTRYFAGKAR